MRKNGTNQQQQTINVLWSRFNHVDCILTTFKLFRFNFNAAKSCHLPHSNDFCSTYEMLLYTIKCQLRKMSWIRSDEGAMNLLGELYFSGLFRYGLIIVSKDIADEHLLEFHCRASVWNDVIELMISANLSEMSIQDELMCINCSHRHEQLPQLDQSIWEFFSVQCPARICYDWPQV